MTTTTIVYDSAQRRRPFAELRHFWEYRGLLRLLVTRDLTVRYKRSVLGVWWTLLNPLLTVFVFWVVFSNIFERGGLDVPFIVYMTAGILLASYFSQGIVAGGSAIVSSSAILAKVYVPPEVFSLASAVSAAVNFAISLIPLVFIMLLSGVVPSWTMVLTPISIVLMLMLVTGAGLLVASVAVLFYDVFDLVRVLTLLITYLAATFYPLDIIPKEWQFAVLANPLYHHVVLFRAFAYGGYFSWWSLLAVVISSIAMLSVGVYVFSRSWKNVVATL